MASKVVVDVSQVNKVIKGLKGFEKQMPGAAMSAVNRTLDFLNTKVGRIVTSEYNIKVKDVKSTIKKNKARKGSLRAWLKSKGRPLTLSRFRFSPSSPPTSAVRFGPGGQLTGKAYKVKTKIKKSSGMKQLKTNPKSFVQMLSGHAQVMHRTGSSRLPLEVVRTLSVPQMIDALKVSEQIQEEANKKLAERIDHEISFRLKKVSAK